MKKIFKLKTHFFLNLYLHPKTCFNSDLEIFPSPFKSSDLKANNNFSSFIYRLFSIDAAINSMIEIGIFNEKKLD